MIEVKTGELFGCAAALRELAQTKGIPARVGYRISSKILRKAESVLREYNDAREKLFHEFGREEPAGSGKWMVAADAEGRVEFDRQLKDLGEEVVRFELDVKIKLEELGDRMDPAPAPGVYHALEWLIEE